MGTLLRILTRIGGPLIGLFAVALFFVVVPPGTWPTSADLRGVAVQTIIVGIAACGATLIILCAQIDLSVGSGIALSSVVAGLALQAGWPTGVAIAAATATGVACGLYNGMLVTGLRLPSFIATLGTLGFFRGAAKWVSGSRPVSIGPEIDAGSGLQRVDWLAGLVSPRADTLGLPLAPGVWVLAGAGIATAALVQLTTLGRHAAAVGSNEAAARRSGVRVARTKIAIFAIGGAMTGLAGLFQFARLQQGDPTVAAGRELDVIAAVVIGGASLNGGRASVAGTLIGAFMMTYLRNRCVAAGWENWVQEVIVGHIIIAAVALDLVRRKSARID